MHPHTLGSINLLSDRIGSGGTRTAGLHQGHPDDLEKTYEVAAAEAHAH